MNGLKSLYLEIKNIYRYIFQSKINNTIVFYSENRIYYRYYKSVIEILTQKYKFDVIYITSDINDIIFEDKSVLIHPFYFKIFLPMIFPLIKTKIVIMTMAELNHHHIKRSVNKVNHVYMFHAVNSIHMQYKENAFDYYDTIFCVGDHHMQEIRKTEVTYNKPGKNLIKIGYGWIDDLNELYIKKSSYDDKRAILIAPSWYHGNILDTCIDRIINNLDKSYTVTIRPHPEYVKRFENTFYKLQEQYKGHANVNFEVDSLSLESTLNSALLITDWSGIALEFILGMEKPVIYINTPKKIANPNYENLNIVPLEDVIRNASKSVINPDSYYDINDVVSKAKENNFTKSEIDHYRNNYIYNWKSSSTKAVDYIIKYYGEE